MHEGFSGRDMRCLIKDIGTSNTESTGLVLEAKQPPLGIVAYIIHL
jgi:hypothetical protein